MSETQLDEKCNVEKPTGDSLGYVGMAIMLVVFAISQPLHEVGHAIGLNLIGISATIGFAIRVTGPVLLTTATQPVPDIWERAFVIAAGPGLAAIICGLLGRFWRTECYLAAAYQACYVPFELLAWMLGVNSGKSIWAIPLAVVVVVIPFAIAAYKILCRIMWPE